jgi:hypothetical protein
LEARPRSCEQDDRSCIIVAGPGLTAFLGPGRANVIGARTTDLADVVVREDAFIEGVERVGAGEGEEEGLGADEVSGLRLVWCFERRFQRLKLLRLIGLEEVSMHL